MKKLLLLFCISFIFFFSPIIPLLANHNVLAASNTNLDYVDKDYPEAMDKAKGSTKDMNAAGHVSSTKTYDYSDGIRRIGGPITGITTNSKSTSYLQQMYRESIAGQSDIILAYLYANPPASTYAFIEDMGQSLGFIPKRAYAQGVGFNSMAPLLPLWRAFRNVAYLLLAVFMIVIGFLIMFRKKIDPKTVITVQNALPNIVITLLLITFSYAIVGVLIDCMYLVITIAISVLKPVSPTVVNDAYQVFLLGTYDDVAKKLLAGGQDATLNGLLSFFKLRLPNPFEQLSAGGILNFNPYGVIGQIIISTLAATAGSILLSFILCLIFLFATVRLFFILIGAYIQIIMSLLISPFQLLLGVFPGSNAFESWIKNLIANLAVFPITAIMILIGSIIVKFGQDGATLWAPPMLKSGGVDAKGMIGVIAIGVLLGIPSVVNSVKEALKAKPAVGGGMGGVVATGGAVGQQLFSYYMGKRQLENQMKVMRGFQDSPQNKAVAAGKGE